MNNEKARPSMPGKNLRRALWIFALSCFGLLILDFIVQRKAIHGWDWLPGFYPVYGFVGCVLLVVIAKWMRTFLMRKEDYYDESELDGIEED